MPWLLVCSPQWSLFVCDQGQACFLLITPSPSGRLLGVLALPAQQANPCDLLCTRLPPFLTQRPQLECSNGYSTARNGSSVTFTTGVGADINIDKSTVLPVICALAATLTDSYGQTGGASTNITVGRSVVCGMCGCGWCLATPTPWCRCGEQPE